MNTRTLLVNGLLPIVIGVLLVLVALVVLVRQPFATDTHPVLTASYKQHQAAAEIHIRRVGTYDGLCDELVLSESATCIASTDAFVVYEFVSRKEGYYCTDSIGYRGLISTISTKIRCQL